MLCIVLVCGRSCFPGLAPRAKDCRPPRRGWCCVLCWCAAGPVSQGLRPGLKTVARRGGLVLCIVLVCGRSCFPGLAPWAKDCRPPRAGWCCVLCWCAAGPVSPGLAPWAKDCRPPEAGWCCVLCWCAAGPVSQGLRPGLKTVARQRVGWLLFVIPLQDQGLKPLATGLSPAKGGL